MNDGTTLEGKTVLITGANRGIGDALVVEALRRGASRVFAGMRQPTPRADSRVTPIKLDVTDQDQIRSAAASITSLDVLVNNAGVMLYDDLSDSAALEQQLAVNLYGPLAVTNAFLPQLVESHGTIVNNVSLEALAPVPVHPSYAISKAAAFNMTQSLRALLAAKGVRVHAMLAGPIDTDMMRGLEAPKATPQSVAEGIFDGVERGEEEIFPDVRQPAAGRHLADAHSSGVPGVSKIRITGRVHEVASTLAIGDALGASGVLTWLMAKANAGGGIPA
jgi:NAD(P)-dependent dehydrogenase (short-subunit alcohol dehydrogenase family)